MTRLLCFGDLHLGAGGDYGAEPGDRLRDQQDVLAMIVQVANENQVDAVLFAGDAFHRRRPTPGEMLAWSDPLRDLEAPLVAIAGNHDVEAADAPIALDVLAHTARLSKRPEVIHIVDGEVCPAYVPGGFSVATLPWTPVSRLIASGDGGDRDQLHEEAAAMLVAAARGLRAEIPAETPAVLLAHWSITEATVPNGMTVGPDFGVALDVDALGSLGFDCMIAGHIHRHQFLGGPDSRVFYTGSPLPVDFGEANIEHGCVIVTLGEDVFEGFEYEFVPITSRPFVTVDVDLTTDRHEELGVDETDAVAAAIATHLPVDDAVVKIRYRATEEQARRIDWPKLRILLDDCHKVFAITGDIVRSDRSRVDGMDEDLPPLVAVDAWCDANEIADRVPLAELSALYLQEIGA